MWFPKPKTPKMEKKTGRGVQKWTFKGQCDVDVSLPPPGRSQTFLVFTFTTATIASWEIFGPCDFSQGVFVFRPVSQGFI